ncbi:MAG: hypothetical protein AAF823_14865 [Planctomycetota bacterium]
MIGNARMCGWAGGLMWVAVLVLGVGCEATRGGAVEVSGGAGEAGEGGAKPQAAGEERVVAERVETVEVVEGEAAGALSEGYALLHGVVGKQRRVAGLFLLKRPGAGVRAAVEAVGEASGAMYRWIEGEREVLAAAGVALGDEGLPTVEAEARGAIEKQTRGAILFGGAWERALVLSQVSSTEYLAALGRALAEAEVSEARADRLRGFAEEMAGLHAEMVGLLEVIEGEDAGGGGG